MLYSKPISVFEVKPGARRDHNRDGVLELLPPEPIPCVGDILLLDRKGAGASEDETVIAERLVPYRVVEREWMYITSEKNPPGYANVPADEPGLWIYVTRIPPEQYESSVPVGAAP